MGITKNRIAVYPGSFNPFTIGHLNILQKAEAIFGVGNVIIAVGRNPLKPNPQTAQFASIQAIKQNMPSKKVEKFDEFLTDYIWEKEKDGYDVTIIRGLRNGDDLDYEVNQLRFMEEMKPDVKVVFITCDKQFEHVSSSAYRALEAVKPFSGYKYIAKEVPSTKMIASSQCAVIVKKEETDLMEKYTIIPKEKSVGFNLDFSGTYVECLGWIKEQESK
jgi:pantetheine-phosphate adenylyltransferase